MKNIEIKKEIANTVKGHDKYEVVIRAWFTSDGIWGDCTYSEVYVDIDGDYTAIDTLSEYAKNCNDLTDVERKEMFDKMKKVAKYLEKHFSNITLDLNIVNI